MMRSHRLPAVAAALALAVAGAGCNDDEGGGNGLEPQEYINELNSAQIDYATKVTDAISGASLESPTALADAATEMQSITEASADEIEGIEAPDEVADLQDEFVAEMRDAATEFGDAADAFEGGDQQEIAAAATQLQTASSEVQTNLARIVDEINQELGAEAP
jgi:DNA replication initiation complex subunit (GINS family)